MPTALKSFHRSSRVPPRAQPGAVLLPTLSPEPCTMPDMGQLLSPCWKKWMNEGKFKAARSQAPWPASGPAPAPSPLHPTCAPVAAGHHLLTVDDDELLQSLPGEAAPCLAAVCVPTRAPHTHVLHQGGTKVGGRPWENGAQTMSKSHGDFNSRGNPVPTPIDQCSLAPLTDSSALPDPSNPLPGYCPRPSLTGRCPALRSIL